MTDKPRYINVKGKLLDLAIPKVMGIINVTPDSFYEKSRASTDKDIIEAAVRMTEDGASIIDIGGCSTRPGAKVISAEEEKKRVLSAIKLVNLELPDSVISIDTFRSEIAAEAVLECGAAIINDISGGESDKNMFRSVEKLNVPYVLMHMKGTPGIMDKYPVYDDIIADLLRWFGERIFRLRNVGVKDIILDPGFGFGKSINQNFELLRRLGDLSAAGLPVLAGVSRKSMIWKTLYINQDEALNGTSVLNTAALLNGCDLLRVHDVKEAVQAIKLVEMLKHGNPPDLT